MDNIYDVLRRYEFNRTESETLQELVKKATEKGTAVQQDLKNLARATQILASMTLDEKLVVARPFSPSQQKIPPMVGIDGSWGDEFTPQAQRRTDPVFDPSFLAIKIL